MNVADEIISELDESFSNITQLWLKTQFLFPLYGLHLHLHLNPEHIGPIVL